MIKIAELLFEILKELKITNKHLEKITGKEYRARQDPMLERW